MTELWFVTDAFWPGFGVIRKEQGFILPKLPGKNGCSLASTISVFSKPVLYRLLLSLGFRYWYMPARIHQCRPNLKSCQQFVNSHDIINNIISILMFTLSNKVVFEPIYESFKHYNSKQPFIFFQLCNDIWSNVLSVMDNMRKRQQVSIIFIRLT